MVVVTWPSIPFEIECVSVGVGGKNKTKKKKRQTSNNNSIGWLDRQHALIFSRWFQRSGRAPFYFAYPLFSWLLTVYGQLYSPTLIRLHSVLSIEQKKWPQRIAPESNTLFPFLLFFFSISNTHCWWMYELQESCSLPFILVPLIKVVRICWADDWFNDDDQLESQPDRYSIIYSVDSR